MTFPVTSTTTVKACNFSCYRNNLLECVPLSELCNGVAFCDNGMDENALKFPFVTRCTLGK